MDAELQTQIAFHLVGRKPAAQTGSPAHLQARPALLARHRDLTSLRYDFPLVVLRSATDKDYVQCLSGLMDEVVHAVAGDDHGDRLIRHLLRLEREIRVLVAEGYSGALSALWDEAAARLLRSGDDLLKDTLTKARKALKVTGEIVDCNKVMPGQLFMRAWGVVQERKTHKLRDDIRRLSIGLSNILQADAVRSAAGRSATNLKASIGSGHANVFDFDALSRVLSTTSTKDSLPASRRQRIESLLKILKSQRFLPMPTEGDTSVARELSYAFTFESCVEALQAYRERLPGAMELARAVAVAELEVEGAYREATHDPLFKELDDGSFGQTELAHFPDYLVSISADKLHAAETDSLMELLSAGLPAKILVQTDDLLEESTIARDGHFALGMRSKQLASMAMGLNDVYVLQSASSNLFQFRDRILKGMTYAGPALFSVYSGAAGEAGSLPPYLMAAAAMESRAFPAYAYDPSAGSNWASRFHLDSNPQLEADWPVQVFTCEDENHQSVRMEPAFTFADFVACDARHAHHFAPVQRAKWNDRMIFVDEYLSRDAKAAQEWVPVVLLVDQDDRAYRAVVDEKLIRATQRCRESWHSLQELGGIHNSHAQRLLDKERVAREEQSRRDATAAPPSVAASPAPAAATPDGTPAAAEPAEARSPDEAYIETPRCTTCNECTQINDKMFAYNENKQAHIANADAGTFAQLVEAAESCQVSIIHPGKPRNASEPGLAELLKRAEPFA
jgi:hypothetical protein